jgi:hypothetical protein
LFGPMVMVAPVGVMALVRRLERVVAMSAPALVPGFGHELMWASASLDAPLLAPVLTPVSAFMCRPERGAWEGGGPVSASALTPLPIPKSASRSTSLGIFLLALCDVPIWVLVVGLLYKGI